MTNARVHQISISDGGVPKRAVESARITRGGIAGDRQNDLKHHGGPDRAICLFSLEVIQLLRSEGHPIAPGTAGDNLTLEGLDWSLVIPGARLRFSGGVELEIVSFTVPCSTIRPSFKDSNSKRIKQELHPGHSRVYARVLNEGALHTGASVELI